MHAIRIKMQIKIRLKTITKILKGRRKIPTKYIYNRGHLKINNLLEKKFFFFFTCGNQFDQIVYKFLQDLHYF